MTTIQFENAEIAQRVLLVLLIDLSTENLDLIQEYFNSM